MNTNLFKNSMIFLFILIILIFSGCENIRDYRQDMRDFVENISNYSKNIDSDFIIIPQNGQELLTLNGDAKGNISKEYIDAIDGVGREDLFYGYTGDNIPTPESEQDYMISFLDLARQNNLKILVTDYCWSQSYVNDSYSKNEISGYISFAASHRELDNIPIYPIKPFNINSNTIKVLKDAKNFLYLINTGSFSNKNDFLNTLKETNYDVLIIDLFYEDTMLTKNDIDSLKLKKDGGERLVIAYISIGEAEDYRYYWKPEWKNNPPDWLLNENPDWPGNYKIKYWDSEWQKIIYGNTSSYLYKIITAGFNGAYLDMVDAFEYFEMKKIIITQFLSRTKSHHIAN